MGRCAGAQGRFWEMHDAIYALPVLSASALDGLPSQVGLDADAYAACVASDEPLASIREDIAEGHALGVTGTPAIFVNNKRMESVRVNPLAQLVDHILAQ